MTFKVPGMERRVHLTPLRIAGLVGMLLLLWVAYLTFNFWQAQRSVYAELPRQARGVLTPEPEGTEPVIYFPDADKTPTSASKAGSKTPTVEGPTPFDPGEVGPAAGLPVETPGRVQGSISSWDGKKRINVLLLGLDQREDEITRPDTIMLASLDFEHDKAYVLSVPRDLFLKVPGGFGWWKVNAAYVIGENPKHADNVGGGVGLMMETLRSNFGIDAIDEFGQITFDGFVSGVDAVGGIDINVPEKVVDTRYPKPGGGYETVVFEPGVQHMDGERALKYARTRHADSDFGRIQRQQRVLAAVRQKASDPTILVRAPSLLDVIGDSLKTSLSLSEQMRLARWAASLSEDDIEYYTLEGTIGSTQDGQSVVWPNWERNNPTLQKVFGPDAGHPTE